MSGIGQRIKKRREQLKLSQPQLARKVGNITYQAIQAVEKGGQTKHLIAIAKALGVTPDWLQDGSGEAPPPAREPPAGPSYATDTIKILGMAECGPDGWSLWNGDVIGTVPTPASLRGVPNAFAVYTRGESMIPRYEPGELAFVNPGKPVTQGCYVLVQLHPKEDGEPPRAVIKRLARVSATKYVLEQFNPPKTFSVDRQEIKDIYRIVLSGDG